MLEAVIRKIRMTALIEKCCNTNFYNLDVIISIGYGVNRQRCYLTNSC